MIRPYVARWPLAVGLAILACSAPQAGEDTPSVGPRQDSRSAPVVTDRAQDATADSLVLTLGVERREPGDRLVRAALRVHNAAAHEVVLYLRGRTPTVDLAIASASGGEVARRLADVVIPAIIQARTLAPGESFTERVEWRVPTSTWRELAAGEFTLRAYLLTEGTPLASPPVGLRIQ